MKHAARNSGLSVAVTLLAALAIGCGEKPPAKSGDWTDNLKQANPDAEPDLTGADEDPEPKPDPAPVDAPKPDTKPQPTSGRPLIQYGPKASIESTFGATPGSKLQLTGGITLVIPEQALDTGYNIVWKVAGSSAPKKGPVLGGIAMLKVNPGTILKARKVTSKKDPFQIRLPTGSAETVNLAIGEVATDDNGNETGKVSWTVIAPKRVDKAVAIVDGAEKEERTATFEIPSIGPVLYVHATSADPS